MRFYLPFLWFCLILPSVFAQNPKRQEINLEQFIQQRVSLITEDINQEDLYESLFQLYQNPLDINRVSADELASLHILSAAQIKDFVAYRLENGSFLSLYELQAIPSFTQKTINEILPFIALPNRFEIGKLQPANLFFIIRTDQTLEEQKGYSEPEIYQGKPSQRYMGGKQRVYTRLKVQTAKNFSAGFTAEKDAGEQGIDFISFHGQLQNRGAWRNIVVGDYQVQIGQGMLSSAGFVMGKGGEAVSTVRRGNVGVRPYSSSLEGGFYRGIAGTFVKKNIEITPFVSINKNDATLNKDDDEGVSSILNNGYHRTESERNKKNQLFEQNYGLNTLFKHKTGQIGLAGVYTKFDKTLERKPTYYNEFEFQGNQNHIVSLHFSQFLANLNVFGEVARSKSGGTATLIGAMLPVSKRLDFSVLIRNYDKNFHSFYGNAFGENSRVINERGAYFGLKYSIHKKLAFNAFVDFFRFPAPKYLVIEPSKGNDLMARLLYTPSKITSFTAQYFYENKEKNLPGIKPATQAKTHRSIAMINAEHAFNKVFSIQSRLQMNDFQYDSEAKSKGYMAMQDVGIDLKKWTFNARIAYFKTDDYDTRIYTYERDVLYAVSFPAYYRKGFRSYLVTRYDFAQDLSLYFRIARTTLAKEYTTIGSGLDLIDGRIKTDIKLQLVWRH
jgi:Helix-hairpin-helix motif